MGYPLKGRLPRGSFFSSHAAPTFGRRPTLGLLAIGASPCERWRPPAATAFFLHFTFHTPSDPLLGVLCAFARNALRRNYAQRRKERKANWRRRRPSKSTSEPQAALHFEFGTPRRRLRRAG